MMTDVWRAKSMTEILMNRTREEERMSQEKEESDSGCNSSLYSL